MSSPFQTTTLSRFTTSVRKDPNGNGIYLVPSIHYSFPFAEAVGRGLWSAVGNNDPFTRLFLEVPRNCREAVPLIARNMPSSGIVVSAGKKISTLACDIYDSTGKVFAKTGEALHQSITFPVSTTDSIATACWFAHEVLPADLAPSVICGDAPLSEQTDEVRREHCSRLQKFDPCRITIGEVPLGEFWERVGPIPVTTEYDKRRDFHMGGMITMHTRVPAKLLGVVGGAHLKGITNHVVANSGGVKSHRKNLADYTFEFVPIDPSIMHGAGWMEIPFLAGRFADYLKSLNRDNADHHGFDPGPVMDELIENAVRRHPKSIAPRSLSCFHDFNRSKLVIQGKWRHTTVSQLSKIGEQCVDRSFGETIRDSALESSLRVQEPEEDQRRVVFLRNKRTLICRLESGALCIVQLPGDPDSTSESENGSKQRDESDGYTDIPEEYTGIEGPSVEEKEGASWKRVPSRGEHSHRKAMNLRIRHEAHRQLSLQERNRSKQWCSGDYIGKLELGIDVQGTLRESLLNKNSRALKIRKRIPGKNPPFHCRNLCPVVYVFDPDLPADAYQGRQSGSYVFDDYSVTVAIYHYIGARQKPHPSITLRKMGVYANLYSSEAPSYDKVKTRQWVESLPPNIVCRRSPWYEDSLSRFRSHPLTLSLAWAIWYAEDHICVVSEKDFQIPPEIVDLARERNIQIARVPSSAIGTAHFERLQWDTEVPTAENTYWSGPASWTDRFTPRIPRY